MRWKSLTPETGTKRSITKFLWIPTYAISNREWRWLETVTMIQMYSFIHWITLEYVNKAKNKEYKINSGVNILEDEGLKKNKLVWFNPPAEIDYDKLPEINNLNAKDLRTLVEKGVKRALKPWEVKITIGNMTRNDELLQDLYNQTVQNYTDTIMETIVEELFAKK